MDIKTKKNLTGKDKAAILFLTLDKDVTEKILGSLDQDEVKDISITMASLYTVQSEVVEDVYKEFTEKVTDTGSVKGSIEATERFLREHYPDDVVEAIMEDIRGPAGRNMWEKLGNVTPQVLANYLKNEYPQTVALILTKVRSEHAAAVFNLLPKQLREQVVERIIKMGSIQREIIDNVEQTLKREFMSNLNRTQGKDGHFIMAEIFNRANKDIVAEQMGILEAEMAESAEKISKIMFTFEDLSVRVDGFGIQSIIKECDKNDLAKALKGSNDEIKEAFFSNMSERAGNMLRDEIEGMPPIKMKDVEEAQARIISVAKQLSDAGEIVISTGDGGKEQLVY